MHGLHLSVAPIERLQRSDCEELTFEAEAEERDGRIDEAVDVKRMHVLGRAVGIRERKVALQQLAYVLGSRVVDRDLALRHERNLRDQNPAVRFAVWCGLGRTPASGYALSPKARAHHSLGQRNPREEY